MPFLIILVIGSLIFFFFIVRNQYTCRCALKANEVIYKYVKDLINKGQYNIMRDYYNEMEISYDKHMFSFWKWGKYSIIKDEYLEVLKPYMI